MSVNYTLDDTDTEGTCKNMNKQIKCKKDIIQYHIHRKIR